MRRSGVRVTQAAPLQINGLGPISPGPELSRKHIGSTARPFGPQAARPNARPSEGLDCVNHRELPLEAVIRRLIATGVGSASTGIKVVADYVTLAASGNRTRPR